MRLAERHRIRVTVEIGIAFLGVVLSASALFANQRWLDHHFLPSFYVSRTLYLQIESIVRVVIAVVGVVLALVVRRPLGKFIANQPARALQIALAVLLAFPATEFVLRLRNPRVAMTEEEPPQFEPSRRLDARLGWVFVPSRTGHAWADNRSVDYSFDSGGYRVRSVDEPVNLDRPTIVFTGESMMVGEQLTWDETIPAQTGAILGLQTANLAVSGFANDQAYLRLQNELPRFRQPVAVVTLFAPLVFDRNLVDDRPHLGPGLVWLPAASRWRLMTITKFLVPYRSGEEIERGVSVTREVLRSTIELARARGAVPIIVVPQFLPEAPEEREIRSRVLDEAGLPYVWVQLDESWRVPNDGHPDVRAAHAIAIAVANNLRSEGLGSNTGSSTNY
jgi:hypothetical protein